MHIKVPIIYTESKNFLKKCIGVLFVMILFGVMDKTFIGIWLKQQEGLKTITRKIEIQGVVRRTGIYLTEQRVMDLEDIVKLAGGLRVGYKLLPGINTRYTLSNFSSINVTSYTYYMDYPGFEEDR